MDKQRGQFEMVFAKVKEDQELDALIKEYIGIVLCHKIVMSPVGDRVGKRERHSGHRKQKKQGHTVLMLSSKVLCKRI